MDFIGDFWTYCSCYEIPRNYAFWSALSLVGATMHRKINFVKGDMEIHSADYVLLIGPMGNKKSTVCEFAESIFQTCCPNLHIGASNQSVEDIVRTMASEDFGRTITNERGESMIVRPYAFFIGEFKNFIAYNPIRMVNFLTDIYSKKYYNSGTIKRGTEIIINPSVNILGCENPDQLVKFMKNDTVTGGMARRVIMVYEPDYAPPIPRPFITPAASAAWQRVKDRIVAASKLVGRFVDTPKGAKFFDAWYIENHKRMAKETNPVIKGYLSTKDTHLFKAAMQIDVVSDRPMFQFTDELLQTALAFLDAIEGNMPKLTLAAGRNETIPFQMRALELLKVEGWMDEKQMKRELETDLTPLETYSVIRHLEDTDQIIKKEFEFSGGVRKLMLMLPWKYEEMKKK